MEEFVKSIENIIIRENQKLKTELKQELKTELKEELSTELKKELGQEIQNRFLVFEFEYGRKIDAIYDLVMLQKEKLEDEIEWLKNLNRRLNNVEVDVLNHETRITALEKSNS